ncbi:MAG: hypothetical protein KatS3mg108_0878 [Isosphaeraceae bacterium]|jgi:hypothetical protein|nr:MAG: hypothetical protein KatS3mg108_0878 [Isosphaeraceae bacterium]
MNERPTLEQLQARVQKQHHREIGNWLARRWARPTAVYGTWLMVRLGLTAHQITALALAAALIGAVMLGTGERLGWIAGVGLLHLSFWLDHVDGQVARWRRSETLTGVYFDYWMHHMANLALGFALGLGLAVREGWTGWAVAGALIAWGWAGLALHNDCRYKAVFQRLKRESRSWRVDGGSGGRPAPAPGWPRGGPGRVRWALLKWCEGHVVLMILTLMAVVAAVDGGGWVWAWKVYAGSMAVLAPGLAIGRLGRGVRAGVADAEFEAWFRDPPSA